MLSVILHPGRERSLLRRHPWVFSGAIREVRGEPQAGDTVDLFAADGSWLARGAFSPASQITVRAWSFRQEEQIGPEFIRQRVADAVRFRQDLDLERQSTAFRLINGESDGLPGVIADRYGEFLVCQFLTAGAERWKAPIFEALAAAGPFRGVYERSDAEVRQKEGLPPAAGVLQGEAPPNLIEITEQSVRFLVDVKQGHKTGFYLDQRDNRPLPAQLSRDRDVLNGFSYTGGFGVWALKGGARSVVNVDSSGDALELGRRNIQLNGLSADRVEDHDADMFALLRRFRDARRTFDLIVLDPPKFAETRGHLEKACRGYKDINLLAFKLLRPGGMLLTFSCSGAVTPELFQKVVADAALDAGREARIVRHLHQAPDHPVALSFPEGQYLSGLQVAVR
jgi:23S rRNA (cytosine1962-C5)-methyltransferase